MPGRVQHRADRARLHDAARVHDRDLITDLADDAEIVRDEDDAQAAGVPQVLQEAQDLRLDGHVERRGRFVAEQDGRLGGQRDRDHHPLAQPAGQLVRIAAVPPRRVGNADPAEQVEGPLAGRPGGQPADPSRCLRDLGSDGYHRIKRAQRVLEDHGQLMPPPRRGAAFPARGDQFAGHPNGPGLHLGGPRQQAHDGAQRHALAAAGLPDDAQGTPGRQAERYAVDGAEGPAMPTHLDREVCDLKQRGRHERGLGGRAHRGRCRSASPSPSSERPTPTRMTAMPGMMDSHGCTVMKAWPSLIIAPQSGAGGWMPRPR